MNGVHRVMRLQTKTHFRHSPAIRFKGERTTRLAGEKLLSSAKIRTLLSKDTNPYLGKLPAAFSHPALEETPLKFLDTLAQQLREDYLPKHFTRTDAVGQPFLTGHYIGSGTFGHVYHLAINNEVFAFKLFNPLRYDEKDWAPGHGPFAEPAAGLFLNARKVKDCIRFYTANPLARWQLAEYINPAALVKMENRPGTTTLDALGYRFYDWRKMNNYIHDIRVDLGGLIKPWSESIRESWKDLKRHLSNWFKPAAS